MSSDDHIHAASRMFAGNLKRIRCALGLSQSELAARCALAPPCANCSTCSAFLFPTRMNDE